MARSLRLRYAETLLELILILCHLLCLHLLLSRTYLRYLLVLKLLLLLCSVVLTSPVDLIHFVL